MDFPLFDCFRNVNKSGKRFYRKESKRNDSLGSGGVCTESGSAPL